MNNESSVTRLEAFRQELLETKKADSALIDCSDGAKLIVNTSKLVRHVEIAVTKTSEVFILWIGKKYSYHELAYEENEKKQTLEYLIGLAALLLDDKFYEIDHTANGQTVQQEIVIYGKEKTDVILVLKTKTTLATKIKLLLGLVKTK